MIQKRIGLLVLSIGNFGNKGFYNLQEIGLAKELDKLFEEVLVYRLVNKSETASSEFIVGCRKANFHRIPASQIGSNGIPNMDKIDNTIDVLVCFSDTQIMFPIVEKWCRRNDVLLIPYIGVSKSHSTNRVKQAIIDLLFSRNLSIYKRISCIAKTPYVADSLRLLGVQNIQVAPVGIDLSIMHQDYKNASPQGLKEKHGYGTMEKIIVFVGRMTAEKQPIRMIDIFKNVHVMNKAYHLIMIGYGELYDEVQQYIMNNELKDYVHMIAKVPNSEMWEYYRMAECLVNLNQREIYGMVLLEAMYYGCKVIAWSAPGPNYIIENGVSGWIIRSDDEAVEKINNSSVDSDYVHNKIIDEFTWSKTASIITDMVTF